MKIKAYSLIVSLMCLILSDLVSNCAPINSVPCGSSYSGGYCGNGSYCEGNLCYKSNFSDSKEAQMWYNAGFNVYGHNNEGHRCILHTPYNNASSWKEAGFTVTEATSWCRAGYDSDDASSWKQGRFTIDEASLWSKAGYDPVKALSWKHAGFTVSQAEQWNKAGFSSPDDIAKWKEAGFTVPEATLWSEARFTVDEAKQWSEAGISLGDAIEWRQAGFTSEAGYTPDDVKAWKHAGFTVSQAEQWSEAGISLGDVTKWKKAGVTADEAAQWNDIGFNLDMDVLRILKKNCKKGIINDLSEINPYSDRDKCVVFEKASRFQIINANVGLFYCASGEAAGGLCYISFDYPINFLMVTGMAKYLGQYTYRTQANFHNTVPKLKTILMETPLY